MSRPGSTCRLVSLRVVPCGLHWIVLIVRRQLLNLIVNFLADEIALFDPSRDAGCSAHLDEAAIVVKHFNAVAIFHHSGFLIDRCNAVAEDGLHSRNVGNLEHAATAAIAGWEQHEARDYG